ncbi:MAG: [FeFe] hydrogenase H-cluster maturation GTPase HydF [Lachnospiraceae bacterium]|jgi:[FeFe] hydrogenase H-cluster maturation GTPase HydF|nr:[FeFe] hydrogenase H-cluster maturation GTPase HydF [Lachnospiraceae bacterium]
MSLNDTPSSERVRIGIFGKRNSGKSSILNAVTGQEAALVSETKGTTTDPVYKAMELLPLGPVLFMDTPGLDDEGDLGMLRVQKSRELLKKTDLALLVIDKTVGMDELDGRLARELQDRQIPFLLIYNKCDLAWGAAAPKEPNALYVSARTGQGIEELKEQLSKLLPRERQTKRLVGDLLNPMDLVVLVVPIDKSAPKGRLILPQQQTIRDVLEAGAVSVTVREMELKRTLALLPGRPRLVITDSQVFDRVHKETPEGILLTSFSILFARYKGSLARAVLGAGMLEELREGDSVLIAEGCTHHRQCEDIGTVKLPRWIREYTGKNLKLSFASGTDFPEDLSPYRLIVHCGGCMLSEREMQCRVEQAAVGGVPMTNFGILIAYMKGILKRSLDPFPEMADLLNGGMQWERKEK